MPGRSSKPRKHDRDPNQRAKLIVDQAMDAVPVATSADDRKNPAAALGRLGGLKGGKAKVNKLFIINSSATNGLSVSSYPDDY